MWPQVLTVTAGWLIVIIQVPIVSARFIVSVLALLAVAAHLLDVLVMLHS